jgi:hypothetical protein
MIDYVPIICPICNSRLKWIGLGYRTGCTKNSEIDYHFVVNYEEDWTLRSIKINWNNYQIYSQYVADLLDLKGFTNIERLKDGLVYKTILTLTHSIPIDILNIQPTLDLIQTCVVFS